MQKKTFQIIIAIVLAFSLQCICYAKQGTELKVFTKIKETIKIYVDDQFRGLNVIQVKDMDPGSHSVRATENDIIIYEKTIDVPEGQVTTILIEGQAQTDNVTSSNLYEHQMEYSNNKLDVLVRSALVGQTYSYGIRSGWRRFGYGEINTISTVREVSDWEIVKGGLEPVSDVDFLKMVGDQDMLKAVQDKKNMESTWFGIDAVAAVIGFGISISEYSDPSGGSRNGFPEYDQGRAVGGAIAGYLFGTFAKYYYDLSSGYHFSPTYAVEKAYKYNLKLKESLGLPADYEPQQ
jgi:hypothetical protein